jgi:hypothetical protein
MSLFAVTLHLVLAGTNMGAVVAMKAGLCGTMNGIPMTFEVGWSSETLWNALSTGWTAWFIAI